MFICVLGNKCILVLWFSLRKENIVIWLSINHSYYLSHERDAHFKLKWFLLVAELAIPVDGDLYQMILDVNAIH